MTQNIVERKIMWGDLDSLGIVFYPRYYEWIDACGHLFFELINLTIGDLWRDRKIQFGLVETSCRYFKPGKYHQKIRIITNIDALNEKTVVLKHTIRDSKDDILLLEGLEKRICLDVSDPENFRAMDIPKDIYGVLKDNCS
ncbi:MAG: thioesterase family protein [Deltaproteobacteria bacterium]|nr:thioesterase family protein [Deltaproteobacteria bacterium]